MAKFEKTVNLPLSQTIVRVENAVMNGSATASLEERSEFTVGNARVAIRVYERYSAFGGNRVSMSVTMASAGGNDQSGRRYLRRQPGDVL